MPVAVSREEVKAAERLLEYCQTAKWIEPSQCSDPTVLGVAIRTPDQNYALEPASIAAKIVRAVHVIDIPVSFTMASDITSNVFAQISPYQTEVAIQTRGLTIPVIGSLEEVSVRKFQISQSLACLVRDENIILLWAYSVETAIQHGSNIEQMLMEMIWGTSFGTPRIFSGANSPSNFGTLPTPPAMAFDPTSGSRTMASSAYYGRSQSSIFTGMEKGGHVDEKAVENEEWEDPERVVIGHSKRPMILTHTVIVGVTLIILLALESVVVSDVLSEIKYDHKFYRIAYLALLPILAGFAFSSALVVVISAFQIIGPVKDNLGNSRYYSSVAPTPSRFGDVELPHITIQIPVFMEGLTRVIVPTVSSIKAAVRYYESVGGTATIFINDDGMQVVSPEIAKARKQYYEDNHISWCARPPHNSDGFLRKGRFKKASNLNYCLDFSLRVEDELLRLINQRESTSLEEENELYQQALQTVLEADQGKTWAAGNIRLGEIILLVDCDTRVPETCLHMGALEMIECPDVAIVQHCSGILKVAHNFFETGISYLSDLVYTAISFNIGSGDSPCFVGHNAFLRWKAVQSIAFDEDGRKKFWTEHHVSEDLHLSLRLQLAGFQLRWATYHGEGFKEGVSLTVFDELARWEKYAYGMNELVFNPIKHWYKGPLSGLNLRYYWSGAVKPSSKLMVLSYTFTYYAQAIALPMTLMNYLVIGWFPATVDEFYVDSWRVFAAIMVIFNVITPVAYCIIRYRLNKQKIGDAFVQTMSWTPLLILFFSGISFHLSKAILCHFVGIDMEWTATAKELQATGFFIGMDRIAKDFKYMYVTMFALTAGMIYLGVYAGVEWSITDWTAIVPLSAQIVCHTLLPVVLGVF